MVSKFKIKFIQPLSVKYATKWMTQWRWKPITWVLQQFTYKYSFYTKDFCQKSLVKLLSFAQIYQMSVGDQCDFIRCFSVFRMCKFVL